MHPKNSTFDVGSKVKNGHSRGSSADCHHQSLSPHLTWCWRAGCVARAIPTATPRGPSRAAQAALLMVIFSPPNSPDHTSERIADDELRDPRSCEQFVHDASWLVRGHGSWPCRRLPLDPITSHLLPKGRGCWRPSPTGRWSPQGRDLFRASGPMSVAQGGLPTCAKRQPLPLSDYGNLPDLGEKLVASVVWR